MTYDSEVFRFAPHNSYGACRLNSSVNNVLVGAHGEDHVQYDSEGTRFLTSVDFTNATVTGLPSTGGGTGPSTTDDVLMPNSTDTLTTKLAQIDTNQTSNDSDILAAQGNITQLQTDLATTTVHTTGDQDIDGIKHFKDNTFRFANNYRFVRDPLTEDVSFQHFDGSSTIPLFSAKPTAATGKAIQMDSLLKLRSGDGLDLDSSGNTRIKESNGIIKLEGGTAGFVFDVNNQTKFAVSETNGSYTALIDGSQLARLQDITDAPIRQLFKGSVIEGGLGDGSTLDTEFRNAISISEFKYQITNPDPIAWAVTSNRNSFTCNCDSLFNRRVSIAPSADIHFTHTNNTDVTTLDYTSLVNIKESATPTVLTATKSGIDASTTALYPVGTQVVDTVLFDGNTQFGPNNTVLGVGVYQVLVEQTSSPSSGGLYNLAARFPLVIGANTSNDNNGPMQELGGSVFTHANPNGVIKLYFEHAKTLLGSPFLPWAVHITFDAINVSDTFNVSIKIKKEVW